MPWIAWAASDHCDQITFGSALITLPTPIGLARGGLCIKGGLGCVLAGHSLRLRSVLHPSDYSTYS